MLHRAAVLPGSAPTAFPGCLEASLPRSQQHCRSLSVYAAGFIGFALIFAWFKSRESHHDEEFSVTGVVAGLAVFALGGLAVAGDYRVAAAGGAILAGVLACREVLHGLLKRLSWIELRSALLLAAMTAVGLPLLPNRTIDPWEGFNPWEVWFFTVLAAGISYLGYIAVRVLGYSRGLLVSGLAGALVSSTAVTVAFAQTARTGSDPLPLAGAASLAAMVSLLRVGTIVLIVEPRVLGVAGLPILAATGFFAAFGAALMFRTGHDHDRARPSRNPFDLRALMLFAALFAVAATASAALVGELGSVSLVATSAVSGVVDVDVAVLTALRMVNQGMPLEVVGQAVLAALAVNAATRLAMAASAGPVGFCMPLAGATAVASGTAYAVFKLVPSF